MNETFEQAESRAGDPQLPHPECSDVPPKKGPFVAAFVGALAIVFIWWSKPVVSLGFDPNDEKCLPDMRLSLMYHRPPTVLHGGDLVFWTPRAELAYIEQEFVMKQVAGVPGDHVVIKDGKVFVNGTLKVSGLALAGLYHHTPLELERDEVVPPGKVFVLGTHPHSDDSRYWGYLEIKTLDGVAFKLL